ncbi:hypothetical protein PWT90_03666 [Aphanocladium album]|nr:hypothetical protein PWT90_03666 [Aphanocladium album]
MSDLSPSVSLPCAPTSWPVCASDLALLGGMTDGKDYWRLCLPGETLYVAGVGTIYYVGNVKVVATARAEQQGTVSGVYHLDVIECWWCRPRCCGVDGHSNSIMSNGGGKGNQTALLSGNLAGYYGTIAMTAMGFIVSFFFYDDPVPEQKKNEVVGEELADTANTPPETPRNATPERTSEKTLNAKLKSIYEELQL